MDTVELIKWLTWTLLYSFIWIFIMVMSFVIIEKITQFSLKKEIIEDENVALWTMFAWFFIAVSIIIAAAIV